jgi:hypothetical protein
MIIALATILVCASPNSLREEHRQPSKTFAVSPQGEKARCVAPQSLSTSPNSFQLSPLNVPSCN